MEHTEYTIIETEFQGYKNRNTGMAVPITLHVMIDGFRHSLRLSSKMHMTDSGEREYEQFWYDLETGATANSFQELVDMLADRRRRMNLLEEILKTNK